MVLSSDCRVCRMLAAMLKTCGDTCQKLAGLAHPLTQQVVGEQVLRCVQLTLRCAAPVALKETFFCTRWPEALHDVRSLS